MFKKRRDRERQQRRQAILDAAVQVMAEHGVEGASMEAIAERADLSKALIYYYFPDKQALHEATAVALVQDFFDELARTAPPDGDLAALVEALLGLYLRRFREDRALLRVIDAWMVHGSPQAMDSGPMAEIAQAHRPWMERLATLLSRSPWAQDPRGFQAFLFDLTVILKDLCLAGRDEDAQARVRFTIDLVRRAARGDRP